jgi:transcriptional antiterminator Rof (Rho-off)
MFTEKSYLEDTIIPSSIEGVWQVIYRYDDLMGIFKYAEKITYNTTLEFKENRLCINKYDCDDYDTVQYVINRLILSYVLENGEKYYFKVINIFNNEYLVMETIRNIQRYKDKTQRPYARFLFKRVSE